MKYRGKLYGKVGNGYFPLLETTENVDLLHSIIDKMINEDNPTYTDAEKKIIQDLIDRRRGYTTYEKLYKSFEDLNYLELSFFSRWNPAENEGLCDYCGYLKPDHEERCVLKTDILNSDKR